MAKNNTQSPRTIYLKDYTPPAYWIDAVDLYIDIHNDATNVTTTLNMRRNPDYASATTPLDLHGDEVELVSLAIDGEKLAAAEYQVTAEGLTIKSVPEQFVLTIENTIKPQENTALSGLYKSKSMYCTQCEAHGFRRITYFLDRPDVMAKYTTTIEADKASCPVLLANGNRLDQGQSSDPSRHWAKWEDPFKKPSYLFAMVAGDLVKIEDSYTTASGREVALQIFVENGNEDKCQHAMQALQKSMRWDEENFGREYDLDIYMLVAVGDFNMGAMENKGLNIFNTKYVLAKPETATDRDYQGVELVVAHEYFHNWTGNRVTCRDWFQLSLKEGLTVFREQLFTEDQTSVPVCRIEQAKTIRSAQFSQDAGPMAHPIRPDAYVEINNFYTVTVYNKGAEVIRMLRTLVGKAGFRKGMDLYFERHDGQAVTTDDFVAAIADANQVDLSQFLLWYSQAGTPVITAKTNYDASKQEYTFELSQHCPATPGQPEKKPFHMPFAVGLLDENGEDMALQLSDESQAGVDGRVLELRETTQQFTFINVPHRPVPSLLRNFTAPVKLAYAYSVDELAFLFAHDSDPYNRWEAGQQLLASTLFDLLEKQKQGQTPQLPENVATAYRKILSDESIEKTLRAHLLMLPSETYLAEQVDIIDVDGIHRMRRFIQEQLALQLQDVWHEFYQYNKAAGPYSNDAEAMRQRCLKNLCLAYLAQIDDGGTHELLMQQFTQADNMTDSIAALSALADIDCPQRETALAQFYQRWTDEDLVLDKWYAIQATSCLPDRLTEVQRLMQDKTFDIKNPNRMRALIAAFCTGNQVQFHAADGAGYVFLTEQILHIDGFNPQMAARLMEPYTRWRKFDDERQKLMQAQLKHIVERAQLSKDVYEIAAKSLEF